MDDFLEDLNPPQRDAVLHERGPLLVLAGAGSGKTRVITRRIASLVRDRKVPAWRILAVTFTNKAAKEMRERLDHLLGPLAQGLTVSTFHSASALILRREAENVGLERNFVIYDDGDQLQVVRRAIREVGIDVASVTPDRQHVSFMWSFPNWVPLPAAEVARMGARLAALEFDAVYGAWWDRVIPEGGKSAVAVSVERYIRAVTGPAPLAP